MPLVFRCINDSKTSFSALSGELTVGSFRKDKFSDNLDRWSWFLSGVRGPASIVEGRGIADDIEACKAALEANWQRWLELAGLQERS